MKQYLMFDINPNRIKAIVGSIRDGSLLFHDVGSGEVKTSSMEELPCWDIAHMHHEMKRLIKAAVQQCGDLESFGIQTGGGDYGFVNAETRACIGNPLTFANADMEDAKAVHALIPEEELFSRTGMSFLQPCTIYQLMHRIRMGERMDARNRILMLPDLLACMLTGAIGCEYTNASVTVLYNAALRDWDEQIIHKLGLPNTMFCQIDYAGTRRGVILPEIAQELGIPQIPHAVVGSHDTASMLAGIPTPIADDGYIYCIVGEPTMFAFLADKAIISEPVHKYGYTNEGTVDGGYALLKNVVGISKNIITLADSCKQILCEYLQMVGSAVKGIIIVSNSTERESISEQIGRVCGIETIAVTSRGAIAGNLLMQAIAAGEIPNYDAARQFLWESETAKR